MVGGVLARRSRPSWVVGVFVEGVRVFGVIGSLVRSYRSKVSTFIQVIARRGVRCGDLVFLYFGVSLRRDGLVRIYRWDGVLYARAGVLSWGCYLERTMNEGVTLALGWLCVVQGNGSVREGGVLGGCRAGGREG